MEAPTKQHQPLPTSENQDYLRNSRPRTDGTIKVGQFDLGDKLTLKLKNEQLVTEFIKKEA